MQTTAVQGEQLCAPCGLCAAVPPSIPCFTPAGFANILKILNKDSSREELLSFIQQFGSHYIAEALYGSEFSCTIHFPSKKVQQQLWLQYQKGEEGSALSAACFHCSLPWFTPSPAAVPQPGVWVGLWRCDIIELSENSFVLLHVTMTVFKEVY